MLENPRTRLPQAPGAKTASPNRPGPLTGGLPVLPVPPPLPMPRHFYSKLHMNRNRRNPLKTNDRCTFYSRQNSVFPPEPIPPRAARWASRSKSRKSPVTGCVSFFALAEIHHPRAKSTTEGWLARPKASRGCLVIHSDNSGYSNPVACADWHRPCITFVGAEFANRMRRAELRLLSVLSTIRRPIGEGSKP